MVRKYMSPQEAATYCGVSAKTLEGWRRQGIGPPYIKVSRKLIKYNVNALDLWLESFSHYPSEGNQKYS